MRAGKVRNVRSLLDYTHYGFKGGINIVDLPQEIADSEVVEATNLYIEPTGSLYGRLGMRTNGPQITGGPGQGIYRFYQNIVGGVAQVVPKVVTVMQVGQYLYNADTGLNYGAIALTTPALPMSCARIFDPQINGGTDILVICTGSGGPYYFDGTSVQVYPTGPTDVSDARWCLALGAVLWFAGLKQPNLLAGSAIGLPESEPGYATFTFSSPVVGLTTLGIGLQATLVAGLVRGVGLVSGFTPNSYIEQEIPNGDGDGVASGLALPNIDGYPYIVGRYSIYRYDGTTFTDIGLKVRPWILCDPAHPEFPMNGDRSITWTMQTNRRLYFWYCSNSAVPNTALVWDLVAKGWSIYTGVQLSAGCAIDAPSDPVPTRFVVCDANIGQQHDFDVFNSTDPVNSPWAVSDNGVPVVSSFASKFYKIGDPGCLKRMIRAQPEVFVLKTGAGSLDIAGDDLSGTNVASVDVTDQMNDTLTDAPEPQFKALRADFNLQAEAFSVGFSTPPTTVPVAPWRFAGFTGRISQSPRT